MSRQHRSSSLARLVLVPALATVAVTAHAATAPLPIHTILSVGLGTMWRFLSGI